jgi:adenylate kinase family enzyme
MTPTLPDNWDDLRSSRTFVPIRKEVDKMQELKQKINEVLDSKRIFNDQIRLELIKIIIEEEEWF